ncbi:MAG: hypothetical protein LBK95_09875 [Bifidobacteriaceae bacterium]|jgi:hypothetical protein|nr:hypothetical protein [Bifidobacteriaceae bacterium]
MAQPARRPNPQIGPGPVPPPRVPEPWAGEDAAEADARVARFSRDRMGVDPVAHGRELFRQDADALEEILDRGPAPARPAGQHLYLAAALGDDESFREYAFNRVTAASPREARALRAAWGALARGGRADLTRLASAQAPDPRHAGTVNLRLSQLALVAQVAGAGRRAAPMSVVASALLLAGDTRLAGEWADAALTDQPGHPPSGAVRRAIDRHIAATPVEGREPGPRPRRARPAGPPPAPLAPGAPGPGKGRRGEGVGR